MNILEIHKKDDTTYYEWDAHQEQIKTIFWHSWRVRYLCFACIAALLVTFSKISNPNFIGLIVSILSILVGFGISVLFYIASSAEADQDKFSNREKELNQSGKIQELIEIKKLMEMQKELFYNIAFFVTNSIISLIICIFLILPNVVIVSKLTYLSDFFRMHFDIEIQSQIFMLMNFCTLLVEFCLGFFVVLTVHSIFRLTRRILVIFDLKMKH